MNRDPARVAGDVVRRCVDAPQTEAGHAMARRRLVDRVSRRRSPLSTRRAVTALAAALFVVTGIAVWGLLHDPGAEPLTYTVAAGRGAHGAEAEKGSYFAPMGTEPVELRFVEGSRIRLEPASRARIARTTEHGASLLLETGTARLEIEPRPGADWRVSAGPYSVMVQGTAFSVSWDASTGTFEVQMDRGVVLVRGPGVEDGVELSGTQHFVMRVPGRERPEEAAAPRHRGADDGGEPSRPEQGEAAPSSARAPQGPSTTKPERLSGETPETEAPAASWTELSASGQYGRVVQQARARGVDSVLQGAGLADLWAFADAARVTGQGGLARRALLAVRARFPGSGQAASAAFLLGRMADDGGGAAGALQWYDRYLAEAPGGAFAPEAQGRRMVGLKQSGNMEAGRRAAEAYLKQFPSGPYAAVAREMLAR